MNGLHQTHDQRRSKARRQAAAKMPSKKSHNPIDKHVGARVRMRRMMVGLSQEKLGDKLGITFQQIQKYEKGTNRISASKLQQIATILGTPIQFFFAGAPTLDATQATQEVAGMSQVLAFESSQGGLAIMAAYNRAPDEAIKRSIVSVVEKISAAAVAAFEAGGRRIKEH